MCFSLYIDFNSLELNLLNLYLRRNSFTFSFVISLNAKLITNVNLH